MNSRNAHYFNQIDPNQAGSHLGADSQLQLSRSLLALLVPLLLLGPCWGAVGLGAQVYFALTGLLLIAAAALMVLKRTADAGDVRRVRLLPATLAGAATGFLSGVTVVGGGIFLTPLLIVLGWASPRQAAGCGGLGAVLPRDRLKGDGVAPASPWI
jgi:uncharacterized membrane protein YfcA